MSSVKEFSPTIVVFACEHSAYKAASEAASAGVTQDSGIHLVPVPCSGRVDSLHLLKAFEEGADGVLIMGCFKDSCRYVSGNITAERRVSYVRKILGEVGIEPERLKMCFVSSASPVRFVREIQDAVRAIKALGPLNPSAIHHREAEING